MPRHFIEIERSQFVFHCAILKHAVDHAMKCLYGYLPPWDRPKKDTLVRIWAKLSNMNYEQLCDYESPHEYRPGPDKKLAEGSDLTNFIDHSLEEHRTIRLRVTVVAEDSTTVFSTSSLASSVIVIVTPFRLAALWLRSLSSLGNTSILLWLAFLFVCLPMLFMMYRQVRASQ